MPLVEQLDGSAPDHADPALRLLALREDRRAGGKELDLGPAREPLERLLIEPAEGVAPPQELGDVVHPSLRAV